MNKDSGKSRSNAATSQRIVSLIVRAIVPPSPGFYTRPQSVADIVDFVVARVLDQLGVAQSLIPRWGEAAPPPSESA